MEEMESVLGVENTQEPERKEETGASSLREVEVKAEVGGEEWLRELERAIGEVILIAKDRVRKLDLS